MVAAAEPVLSEKASARQGVIVFLQGLRGVAALLVVAYHISSSFDVGASGVDIFFVISGFIIVYTSRGLFGRADGPSIFMTKRIIRIVPLYWAVSTVLLIEILVRYHGLEGAPIPVTVAAASFLFIPYGGVSPVVAVGWTLNYEMFFYVVFAAIIALPRQRALAAIMILFPVLSLAGFLLGSELPATIQYWLSPLILEFWLGVGIAILVTRVPVNPSVAAVALTAGFVGLIVLWRLGLVDWVIGDGWRRLVVFGPFAALFVYGAIGLPGLKSERIGVPLVFAGDISYALYLTHTMTLATIAILLPGVWVDREAVSATEFVFLALAAIVVASSLHLFFELPITKWLRQRSVFKRA